MEVDAFSRHIMSKARCTLKRRRSRISGLAGSTHGVDARDAVGADEPVGHAHRRWGWVQVSALARERLTTFQRLPSESAK
jgi:hypothetical protein